MSRSTLSLAVLAVCLAAWSAQAADYVADYTADYGRFELQPSSPLLAAKKKKGAVAGAKAAAVAAKEAAASNNDDDEAAAAAASKDDDEEDTNSSKLPDEEVKAGGTKLGDSVGGATGFVFKQGIYTQSDLGGFFVIGARLGSPTGYTLPGNADNGLCDDGTASGGRPCRAQIWSNLQPYIGLSVGYDISQWLGVQLSFGTGFVANAAVYDISIENPRDYGITTINLAVVGSFYVLERLAIMGKLFGGGAFMTPEPLPFEPTIGGNAGAGIGVRYATLLPDVFVGIDGNFMVTFIPASAGGMVIVPGISFAPVIKYVF